MSSGKTSKYIKYAIGEIILVVIGILIALQINNWNEDRKNATNEAHILNEILNNLNEDKDQISFILERRIATQASIEKLINILSSEPLDEKGLDNEIAQFLTFERFYPLNNAFEMMKSSGQIVKNKELRTTISRYYDFEQKKVAQSIKDIENVFLRIIQSENAIRSNLISANIGTKENAFLKIKNPRDPNFLELLNTELISFTDNNSTGIVRISDFKYFNSQLISSIEAELEKSRLKKHIKAKN